MSLLQRIRQALEPDFSVEREIGAGGMGSVFEALDTRLERKVAVKVLRPELATAVAAQRFLREARLLARLKHPGVVQVHDVGEGDGLSWFVMDLVQGETLAARLTRGPLGEQETLRLGRELLSALAAAHEQGIVHRDIKPANVFIEKGKALLADFGIARTATTSDAGALTETMQTVGTPAYMSPEQRSGDNVGPASDEYSLALVLYECVTGRRWPPMQGAESGDWTGVPSGLASALKRAMSYDPAGRWPDAAAFSAALEPGRGRRRFLFPAGAVAAVVLAAAVWWPASRGSCPDAAGPYSPGLAVTVPCEQYDGWLRAERFYRSGDWAAADTAYRDLLVAHPGCLACELRLLEVDRWLERRPDSARIVRLRDNAPAFGQEWRGLVSAMLSPARQRLEILEDLTSSYRAWPFAWYSLGSELFNRGSFFGRRRSDALAALDQHAALEPGFAPAWTDRTLAQIAIGDSAPADSGLRQLQALPPTGGLAHAQRMLAALGFAFRFTAGGLEVWRQARGDPALASVPELAAGPRVLPGLAAPAGAVELGREFERSGQKPLQRSGMIAQMLSHVALGRPDSARAVGRRLNAMFPSNEFLAFNEMLQAATVLLEEETAASEALQVEHALQRFTRPMMPPAVRRDAAWMSALAQLRRRDPATARSTLALVSDEPSPAFRRRLIEAAILAGTGQPDSALAVTEVLATDLEAWDRAERSPFLRAAARLSRAQWFAATGIPENARSEYRWHEHFHLPDYPVDHPVAADGDWAFSTLAYWRQARLLDRDGSGAGADRDVCVAYRTVAERWSLGDARHRARADTARTRLAAIQCETAP
jgi:hypothetical protein